MSKKEVKKFEGKIQPFKDRTSFYMVVVEDSIHQSITKYEDYIKAFEEAVRLSKKENKKSYIVQAIAKIEQVSEVTNLKA